MLFKVLGENAECVNGGIGNWKLPTKNRPGEWMRVEGEIRVESFPAHEYKREVRKCDFCDGDATDRTPCQFCNKDLCLKHQRAFSRSDQLTTGKRAYIVACQTDARVFLSQYAETGDTSDRVWK